MRKYVLDLKEMIVVFPFIHFSSFERRVRILKKQIHTCNVANIFRKVYGFKLVSFLNALAVQISRKRRDTPHLRTKCEPSP